VVFMVIGLSISRRKNQSGSEGGLAQDRCHLRCITTHRKTGIQK